MHQIKIENIQKFVWEILCECMCVGLMRLEWRCLTGRVLIHHSQPRTNSKLVYGTQKSLTAHILAMCIRLDVGTVRITLRFFFFLEIMFAFFFLVY